MSKITGLEAPNQVPPKVTAMYRLSLIHISEPTRLDVISLAGVFV